MNKLWKAFEPLFALCSFTALSTLLDGCYDLFEQTRDHALNDEQRQFLDFVEDCDKTLLEDVGRRVKSKNYDLVDFVKGNEKMIRGKATDLALGLAISTPKPFEIGRFNLPISGTPYYGFKVSFKF